MTDNTLGSAIDTQAPVEIDGQQDGDGQKVENDVDGQTFAEPISDSERSKVMVRIAELNSQYSEAEARLRKSMVNLTNAQNDYHDKKLDVEEIEAELLQLTKKIIDGVAVAIEERKTQK